MWHLKSSYTQQTHRDIHSILEKNPLDDNKTTTRYLAGDAFREHS